jgi:beta-glucosidase
MDRSLSPDQRAASLVARMTIDEKITELHGIQDAEHRRFVPGIDRLGVPPLVITNGPAGVGPGDDPQQPPATALPAPIALAATWDRAAAGGYGAIQGIETRDEAESLIEAPDVNIARVPENGRTFEGYGEDPYLAGQMAVADIQGIQRQGVIAEVKHYLANNQESARFSINEVIDDRTMHEIYLPQFQAAVQQGHAGAVMCAYPRVNGTFNCEDSSTLAGLLRGQWGFGGFVQSDFGAAHSTAASTQAGMDLEMPTGIYYGDAMKQAVSTGQVPMSTVDRLLVRRLATMIRFGDFGRRLARSPIPARADGAVSRRLAEEAMVLLRNQAGQLPLDALRLHSIALIGPGAGAAMTGGGGSSHVDPLYSVTPVEGMRHRLGRNASVTYTSGSDLTVAAAAARAADVAVVMVGDSETEGRDRSTLALSGTQDQLVEAVADANPHTVVVVKSGAPVLMPWSDRVAAILEAWYPGEEDGNAVAAVLFGDVNPSGKLPITFPAGDGQTPAHTPEQWPGVNGRAVYSEGLQVGYRYDDAQGLTPLYPFGYGLSYTTFAFSHLHAGRPDSQGGVVVDADVTNTGSRPGADVAQVYVGDPVSTGEPARQLEGFERVSLRPGETGHVRLTLDRRAFSQWDSARQAWTQAPGMYQLLVGDSSRALQLQAAVQIAGSGQGG